MTTRKPKLSELIGLLVILSLCSAVLYLYYADEPKHVSTNTYKINYDIELIYTTFPLIGLNQTAIVINSSYILNITTENDILTIIVRDN